MTRSSHPVRKHILEFDDDFERELRRKRKNPEPSESSASSESVSEFEEEVEDMAADNRTIKELSASGLDNTAPLCIQYPRAAPDKTAEFELKSSLLHHIPKYHGLSMEEPNKHLKEFEHQMKEEILLQYFYEGLLPIERQMLDTSAGGALVDKTPTAAKTLISNRALNAQQYEGVGQRSNPRQHQVNEGMQSRDKRMDELEKQVGQIAEFMGQFREQGKLPSSIVVNPKGGFETAKAITLRSGKEVGTEPTPSKSAPKEDEKFQIEEEEQAKATARIEQSLPHPPNASNPSTIGKKGSIPINSNVIPPDVPFPSRFLQAKNEEEEKDVLETFRKVHVNIPLLDAIKQIPKYAKFLKKLCTTRKRIREKEVVHVSENVSALLQRKLPPKCKDPGSFTIPCVIGNTRFDHAMLDLGASINVMPYSVYASMNLGKLKNDGVIIQLADRSNAYPKGVLEDVLVQVDHLIFPADFYVLDMEDSTRSPPSPLLLGRPFMKTAQTKIDVAKGAVTMAFGGDMINFKIPESIENTNDVRSCCAINVIKHIGTKCSTKIKNDVFRTTTEKELGVEHKECTAPTLEAPQLAMSNPCASVHCATTSLPYKGLETKYAKKCKMEHFRAKLSWNGVYANGAPGMDEFEGQRSLRNEEMEVKNKEFRFGNQSF
ncbi:unnamed protein product [Malus baccata var. baccata]